MKSLSPLNFTANRFADAMRKPVLFFVAAFLFFPALFLPAVSQTSGNGMSGADSSAVVSDTNTGSAQNQQDDENYVIPLPDGYLNIHLGMTFAAVKSALLAYPVFGFRGDRDVSILPGFDRLLIETEGDGYLDKCWFQFYDNKLYTISININTQEMDYYSVFRTLCRKYGSPISFSPEKAVWEDPDVIMSLEKPLCIKYSDVKVLDAIEGRSFVEQSTAEKLRQDFLDSL